MISLNQIRQLEPKLKDASDEEVALVREQLYGLANLAFEDYVSGSKIPVGLKKDDDTK